MASSNIASTSVQELENISAKLVAARESLKNVVYGQDQVIDLCLVAILAGGHAHCLSVHRAWPRPVWPQLWEQSSASAKSACSSRLT